MLFKENSEIGLKYPFLYDLVSILNNDSMKSKDYRVFKDFIDEKLLSQSFYSNLSRERNKNNS